MFAKFVRMPWGLLPSPRHPSRFLGVVSGAVNFGVCWLETRRQLRALSELDDHLLRDIGLSREEVERSCSTPFWMRQLRKPRREYFASYRTGHNAPVTIRFFAVTLLIALSASQPLSQEICKPSLLSKAAGHSEVVNLQRKWTGVFAVDASRCSTTAGSFEIEFVRLKEVGPDLFFTERFTWKPEQVEASLDLSWDEWVNTYRISEVTPCPCRY